MKEVFEHFNNADCKTLAIFGVNMVLVQPSDPAFQMANMKRFSTIFKQIMKEIPVEKQMMFLSLMTISSDPVLIGKNIPQFLQQVMNRGGPYNGYDSQFNGIIGRNQKYGAVSNQ
jgi:hypothetical protein